MNKVELAMAVAREAHKGQVDKLGANYIDHPLRVHQNLIDLVNFENILSADALEDCEVAALLHDVVEDTPVTAADLLEKGFSPRSIAIVELVTKNPAIHKNIYYANIHHDELARLVKLADVADNTNESRMAKLDEKKREELKAKYAHALSIILPTVKQKEWLALAVKREVR